LVYEEFSSTLFAISGSFVPSSTLTKFVMSRSINIVAGSNCFELVLLFQRSPIQIRQQVLPNDTLVEVFNYSERADLDQWGIVCLQYDAAAQRAEPLRQVTSVALQYEATKRIYEARFYDKKLDEPVSFWNASESFVTALCRPYFLYLGPVKLSPPFN
jgi:hypothetical protein